MTKTAQNQNGPRECRKRSNFDDQNGPREVQNGCIRSNSKTAHTEFQNCPSADSWRRNETDF